MFTLGRSISFKYPTNKIILSASLVLAITAYLITGSISKSLQMGGSLFLTWALVREIDCKREYAAILAALLTVFNLFIPFQAGIGTIFLMILLLRLINHITGKKGTLIDFLSLVGFATYLSYASQNSIYVFLLFLAYLLNLNEGENKKQNVIFLVITALLYGVLSIGFGYFTYLGEIFTNLPMLLFYGISLLIYFIYIFKDQDKSTLDDLGKSVSIAKILKAQIFYGFAVFLLLVFSTMPIGNTVVFFSAIYGFVLFGLYDQIRVKTKRKA